jgi:hypothetical protein
MATADFFANADSTSIDAVQGDAHLSEIGDVEHQITTAFFNSPVPLYLLGYGENLNRDVLEEQRDQYHDTLDGVAAWLDDQFLIPLLERQWMLQGIWPASLRYTIERPPRKPLTAALLSSAATAVKELRAAGIPDRIVYELLAKLIPGVDVDRIMELKAEEPPPPAPIVVAPAQGSQSENPPAPTAERRNGNGHGSLKGTVEYGHG